MALYGCMKSAILWYETFTKTLKGLGFILNKYDPLVANMNIDHGHQCTICWYVGDDCKIFHKSPKVVDEIIMKIEEKHNKMTVKQGKKNTFVGIDFEILEGGNVKIMMKDYMITECIEAFGKKTNQGARMPAARRLTITVHALTMTSQNVSIIL